MSHVKRTSDRANPDSRPARRSLRLLGSPPQPLVGSRCRQASEAFLCGLQRFQIVLNDPSSTHATSLTCLGNPQ